MKILMVLGYYHPYTSGLSEYVRTLSEELVKCGHDVTVLTSRHQKNLKKEEIVKGVKVIRCNPILKFSKGLVMPLFVWRGYQLSKNHDVVNIHLPLFEAALFCLFAKNTVITYHCDVHLGNNFIENFVEKIYYNITSLALKRAKSIVANTEDYARQSKALKKYLFKCHFVFPPINQRLYQHISPSRFKSKYNLSGTQIVGFVGRIVYEKGIPYILDAIPPVKKKFKDVKFVFVGDYEQVAGGSTITSMGDKINQFRDDLLFLGKISDESLREFYSVCDVLVLPSINSLESLGMVQIEAMLCGTPVVASNLPGVRLPVMLTGMGELAEPKNSNDLAQKLIKVLANKSVYVKDRKIISNLFSTEKTVKSYTKIFAKVSKYP